jgi:conjugal transfer mating pair stabilization protein TraN
MKLHWREGLKTMIFGGVILLSASSLASDKYQPGKQFADSLKGSGVGHLQGFKPEAVIPNYNPNPPETGHYGGVTASGSGGLENVGAGQLNSSDVGKVTTEVIMNRPKDPISMEAPFVSGGFDIQDKADTVTNGTFDKCETVTVDKTDITTHTCERTLPVELSCQRKAHIEGEWIDTLKEIDVMIDSYAVKFAKSGKSTVVASFTVPAGQGGEIVWGRIVNSDPGYSSDLPITLLGQKVTTDRGTHFFYPKGHLKAGQVISLSITSANANMTLRFYNNRIGRFQITLRVKTGERTFVPKVVWSEVCPFDKSEEVLQVSQCTEAGGNRIITAEGKDYPVYSDCWAYKDTYVSQVAENGSCSKYMNDTACTVSKTTCMESLGSVCLREQAIFTCEKKISGEAQLCSGQRVCANGECDQLENNKVDSFGKAVSALVAVTAAAKDVSDLNGVDVRAFTGEKKECRQAAAGFSNCCKDSGWGQGIGLAHCDSEEKALGKAKEKLLTVYVGTYCSNKKLGVCLQKKKAYCQFDSKLAQIVQAQGRKGQLGINFGSGKSPNCRGITIDELQSLRFDNMDFSNFYSDLNAGTTIPADSELADRVKAQIEAALQQAAGKGGTQ